MSLKELYYSAISIYKERKQGVHLPLALGKSLPFVR